MSSRKSSLPLWRMTNGWREIFARIFEGIEIQFNITPEWLINPSTQRRLKLDMFCPDLDVAVRLEGLQGKKRHRLSLEEEDQLRARNEARIRVSQEHGIQLIIVNVATNKLVQVFQHIDTALGRAKRQLNDKKLLAQIKTARATATALARTVTDVNQFGLYADLWEDRHYKLTEPVVLDQPVKSLVSYAAGMQVEHSLFGPGVVLSTTPSDDDIFVTVDFMNAGQKTLAASLVADKLLPC